MRVACNMRLNVCQMRQKSNPEKIVADKYSNRREVRRVGGKFAKQPDLASQGFSINDRERTCAKCGKKRLPILKTWTCECGYANID